VRFAATARVQAATLAVLLLTALVPLHAAAAPFAVRGEDWEGLSQLVRLAESEIGTQRVVVVDSRDHAAPAVLRLQDLKREDALLIVHPERPLDVDELAGFMRAGGRLVLMDDYGTGDELLARFGIRRVPMPVRPAEMLRSNPSLAVAEPASGHAAVRDVAHVVTNHATGLAHPGLSKLLVVHAAHATGSEEPDVLLALAGAVGEGRLIAVGDASLGINSMLRFPGNRALCSALVRYATEDDAWGARAGKLYIVANDFETTGSFGGVSGVSGVLGEARHALALTVDTLRHPGMPPLAAYTLAILVGLGVVLWTSTRAGKTHRRVVPRYVRPVSPAAQGGFAGRAAVVGAPRAARALAMLELKRALEEELMTRLSLDRVPAREDLVEKARAAGVLTAENAEDLDRLLASLSHIESAMGLQQRGVRERIREADVRSVAAQVHQILEK
jgi:hypothetical protein